MTATTTVDTELSEAFAEKVMNDFAGSSACYLGAIGDALGLFTDLAERGPATSAELAGRTGLDWTSGTRGSGWPASTPPGT